MNFPVTERRSRIPIYPSPSDSTLYIPTHIHYVATPLHRQRLGRCQNSGIRNIGLALIACHSLLYGLQEVFKQVLLSSSSSTLWTQWRSV